jgi:hypothetical protein
VFWIILTAHEKFLPRKMWALKSLTCTTRLNFEIFESLKLPQASPQSEKYEIAILEIPKVSI